MRHETRCAGAIREAAATRGSHALKGVEGDWRLFAVQT
jgi:hypothetical protein